MLDIIEVYDDYYKQNNNEDVVTVTWEITRQCNFHCSYCDVYGKPDINDYQETLSFLDKLSKDRIVKLILFGGEPMIHPQLDEILKRVPYFTDIFTNLSSEYSEYERIIAIKEDIGFYATYHPTKADFTEFYEKVKKIAKLTDELRIIFMFDKIDDVYFDNFKKLKELGLPIEIHKVIHDNDRKLTDYQEQVFIEEGDKNINVVTRDNECLQTSLEYVMSNRLNNFKYFKCSGGLLSLYISQEGKVYPCLDYRKKDMPLGSVTNLQPSDLKKTICTLSECTGDIEVPKKRVLLK